MSDSKHIIPHSHTITKEDRQRLNEHKSGIIWFTGLSGSGKSTLASEVERELYQKGWNTYILDGDNIRSGLNQDLNFTPEGRKENIRRIGEVAKLFVDAGLVVLTAFISPYKEDRKFVRELVKPGEFYEIYVNCPLEVCEERDVKGLYQKARQGEIDNFTGIDAPFEDPEAPEVEVRTDQQDVEECVENIRTSIEPKLKIN